ncbi:WD40 repeat-like protein [Suillus decipiens]|nr:WD40 repeat-like protein [Suillus decipiens]
MSTSNDGSIRQWTRDGEPVGKPWNNDGGELGSLAMSPDESMVLSGSADGRLRLWNIKKDSMIGDSWKGHKDFVWSLDWSPDAKEIISGSHDGTTRRWNLDTGRQIAPPTETGHRRVYAVKYSPQGDNFASGGEDKMICIWSKDGELLKKIMDHKDTVTSLYWSKDGAHIFSGSYDATIRKWRSIDGKELVVFQGHTDAVFSLCLSPDESYLVSASSDCSVRIWHLKTNQSVGDPLLHDDELVAVVISPDRKYIASAGKDAKVYIWCLDAALKHAGSDHSVDESKAKPDAKLKGHPVRSRDTILHTSQVFKQQPNNILGGMMKYGNEFWDANTNSTPHPAAPGNPLSSLHWRNFLGSLRLITRLPNTPQSIPLQPRRWNSSLFPVRNSIRTIDVAAGRKKNRIFVSPPTAAEMARAKATGTVQHTNGSQAGSSTQSSQPQAALGIQVSQGRQTETVAQGSSGGTREVSCEVRCCGLFVGCGRPTLNHLELSVARQFSLLPWNKYFASVPHPV